MSGLDGQDLVIEVACNRPVLAYTPRLPGTCGPVNLALFASVKSHADDGKWIPLVYQRKSRQINIFLGFLYQW